MMFRKLYWVTEKVAGNGSSKIAGVFTSVPDLLRHGLIVPDLRLTLTELDTEDGVVETWVGPSYDGLRNRLERLVKDEEITREHADALGQKLCPPA